MSRSGKGSMLMIMSLSFYMTVNTEVKIGSLFTFHVQNGGAGLTQSYQCLCLHGNSKRSDGWITQCGFGGRISPISVQFSVLGCGIILAHCKQDPVPNSLTDEVGWIPRNTLLKLRPPDKKLAHVEDWWMDIVMLFLSMVCVAGNKKKFRSGYKNITKLIFSHSFGPQWIIIVDQHFVLSSHSLHPWGSSSCPCPGRLFKLRLSFDQGVKQMCNPLSVFVSRTQLGRSATAPSPQPTTVVPWASYWCMTSPMRSPSTPSRTGMSLLSRICLSVCVSKSEETTNPKHSNCGFRATQIKTYSWDNAQVIMVGNKCDMDEERVVPPEKGKHLADQLGETLQPRTVNFFYLHPDDCLVCFSLFHSLQFS